MLAKIEWDQIAELLYVAPVAGLTVAITFSVLILGVARAGDAQRTGASRTAAAYSLLAVVAMLAFAATVVFGVQVIITK
jgi:uncharacterized membrane protein YhaH (DUF805 family)